MLPQLISGRERAHAFIPLFILTAGMCACIRWSHSAGPARWPRVPSPCPHTSAPPCVHCALRPPWPILHLLLDNRWIHILILDYTADLQEGFYKGLAQVESHLNTTKQPAKELLLFLLLFCRMPQVLVVVLSKKKQQKNKNEFRIFLVFQSMKLYNSGLNSTHWNVRMSNQHCCFLLSLAVRTELGHTAYNIYIWNHLQSVLRGYLDWPLFLCTSTENTDAPLCSDNKGYSFTTDGCLQSILAIGSLYRPPASRNLSAYLDVNMSKRCDKWPWRFE